MRLAATASQCVLYSVRGFENIFVLPEAQDSPAAHAQRPVRLRVSRPILLQLRPPPLTVVAWPGGVLLARVPEAAINEHNDTPLAEYNVCAPAAIELKRNVDTKTQPPTM